MGFNMEYIVQAATTRGLRKETNQDSFMVRVCSTSRGKAVLAVLCDGMGGLSRGELASASVVRAFERWFLTSFPKICSKPIDDSVIRSQWTQLVVHMNEKLARYGQQENLSLGTTATVLLLTEGRYYILQVGDSRCYEIDRKAVQLTEDQSFVWREYKEGRLTREQAEKDPRRNILLECIGADQTVNPQFVFGTPKKNAVYLLCCDGFYHELSKEELQAELCAGTTGDEELIRMRLEGLIHLCMDRKEQDNISAVAVRTF